MEVVRFWYRHCVCADIVGYGENPKLTVDPGATRLKLWGALTGLAIFFFIAAGNAALDEDEEKPHNESGEL